MELCDSESERASEGMSLSSDCSGEGAGAEEPQLSEGSAEDSHMCLGAGAEEPQLSVGSAEDYQMSLPGSGGSDVEAAGTAAGSRGARRVSGHPQAQDANQAAARAFRLCRALAASVPRGVLRSYRFHGFCSCRLWASVCSRWQVLINVPAARSP